MSRRHDVAIYSPYAAMFYEPATWHSGGAELQTVMLARELTRRGFEVAHIVYPPRNPRQVPEPAPTLVDRARWQGHRPWVGDLVEAAAIWRALYAADARLYVFRGSGGHLMAGAAYCRALRRKLLFSSSNDLDFDLGRPDRERAKLA